MNLKILKELHIYIILLIILLSLIFSIENWNLYEFWQPIIDNVILFVFLSYMLFTSNNWHWFSKRILYNIIFLLILNTYSKLFGLDPINYYHWYITPLVAMIYSITISYSTELIYKLYILKKDGNKMD